MWWFSQNYPPVKKNTVTSHITSCCVNDRNRKHYTGRKNVLYKRDDGSYEKYDRDKHGLFDSEGIPVTEIQAEKELVEEQRAVEKDAEFVLEKHLAEFFYANWEKIDFGTPLAIYRDSYGREGKEWDTGEIGKIDFLCEDKKNGDLVVIELKKGRPTDTVVGQIQRYMGWVLENLAQAKRIKGIIITPFRGDEQLRYALNVAKNIEWKCYQVNFRLVSLPEEP